MKRLFLIPSAMLLLVVFGTAQAQAPADSAVSVKHNGAEIEISVSRVVSLQLVLESVCRTAALQCDGLGQASTIQVAPVLVRGPQGKAIAELIEGSGLNYIFVASSGSQPGSLLLEPRPMLPEEPRVPAVESTAVDNGSAESRTTGAGAKPSAATYDASPQDSSPSNLGANEANSASFGQAGTGSSPLTSVVAYDAEQSPTNNAPQYFPFPDSHGHLIPLQGSAAAGFPFPDAHGNAIPLNPSGETGSPFPNDVIRQANGTPH